MPARFAPPPPPDPTLRETVETGVSIRCGDARVHPDDGMPGEGAERRSCPPLRPG